ncbi:hypothetical protein [Mesorhizobium sp. B1-1-7]|uniref:hypothetical protein n=1 Tax=Mesorhizobium sp. B1-1-7 TaxID=2589977 RepID=UPI001129B090|nr:hypothetical protein [Mesorhizobium sp. B1-1-7]TPN53904.1 hypothetical protein FJ978_07295 [Mesorhizobium sp. B1-1-7]
MTNRRKIAQIRELVRKRREPSAGSPLSGYTVPYSKIGDFHGSAFDFDDHVVPWSKTASNLSPRIMLIAQDWASEDFLSGEFDQDQFEFGYTPSLPSNQNLFRLLREHLHTTFEETFATDAFVFIKPGNMTETINIRDMRRSAFEYALPQIEIIKPRVVLCIGSSAYNAIRFSQGCRYASIASSLGEAPLRVGSIPVFGVHHTGGLATLFAGGPEAQDRQWARLAAMIQKLC